MSTQKSVLSLRNSLRQKSRYFVVGKTTQDRFNLLYYIQHKTGHELFVSDIDDYRSTSLMFLNYKVYLPDIGSLLYRQKL